MFIGVYEHLLHPPSLFIFRREDIRVSSIACIWIKTNASVIYVIGIECAQQTL